MVETNELTGAEALVRMLELNGVTHVFGLCGDTTLPLYDAFARMDHGITHILTRDERHAAYMADGFARVTGRPGICEGPSGGGATYILPGLIEANESSVPVLAITSDVATTSRGKYPLTELDQPAVMAPLTKWCGSLDDANRLPAMLRKAFREMTTGCPGSVHLSLPFDTQKATLAAEDVWADPETSSFPARPSAPETTAIAAAVQTLRSAKRPVLICGGGVVLSGGCEMLDRFCRALDIPVLTTVSGQGALAETHPLCAGVVGSNGGHPAARALVDDADLVFFVGCRAGSVTTERWRSPKPGVRVLHMDNDPTVIGAIYQTDVGMVCDAKLGLLALLSEISGDKGVSRGSVELVAAVWRERRKRFDQLAMSTERPIRPEAVVSSLADLLPEDATIVADPGTPCPYFSAHYRWRKAGRHFITNRAHGALGYALAASVGAHVGRPNTKTVAVMGDGSFGFCCGEFETLVRYNFPITSIVFSNATFGWIKAGQDAGFDKRYYNVDFGRTDHAAVAKAFGVQSWRVEDPGELSVVLEEALGHDGPSLVDVISQPLHEAEAPVSEWVA